MQQSKINETIDHVGTQDVGVGLYIIELTPLPLNLRTIRRYTTYFTYLLTYIQTLK